MKSINYFLILIIATIFLNCKNNTKEDIHNQLADTTEKFSAIKNLPDSEAGEIVKKTIARMGGMNNWENKKTLSYSKTIKFFDSTGKELREIKQLHDYQLQPQLKIKISWEEDGDKYESINNGSQAWKIKNGEEMTNEEDKKSAWNSTFGGHYVATMPFKLTDKGTNLEYLGIETLANGKRAHNIKTTYNEGAGSSAGMHTWWYYFDEKTYQPVGNFLNYGDGFSLIINESFTDVDGLQLPHKRKSYRTNAEREMLSITTDYIYEDYEFDRTFDNNYFEKD